jgi:type II secretory pathway component PulC
MKLKFKRFLWILLGCFGMICVPVSLFSEQEIKYEAYGKRDPFVPLITAAAREVSGVLNVETLEEIALEGVVYDPKNGSVVVANGVFLKEGEESGSVKVLKVEPDGVVFLVNGIEGFKPLYANANDSSKK